MFGFGMHPVVEAPSEEPAPTAPPIPDEPVLVEENLAPDTIPAPAPHPDTLSAAHGYPTPRRCAPQE